MAIKEFTCACGCGKKRFGSKRAMFFNAACKMRKRRADKKTDLIK